jgi:hypothetical protein
MFLSKNSLLKTLLLVALLVLVNLTITYAQYSPQYMHGQIGKGGGESTSVPEFNIIESIASTTIKEVTLSTNELAILIKSSFNEGNYYAHTSQPNIDLPGLGIDTAIASNGQFLIGIHIGFPFITSYKWNSETSRYEQTARAIPDPNGNMGITGDLSENGEYLALIHGGLDTLTTFKWNSENNRYEGTELPDVQPSSKPWCMGLSSNGQYLVLPLTNSPYIISYKWNNTSNRYEKTADIYGEITGPAYGASVSSDGMYVVISHYNEPYISAFNWSFINNRYEQTTPPDINPAGDAYSIRMTPNKEYLAVSYKGSGQTVTHFLYTYKWSNENSRFEKTENIDIATGTVIQNFQISDDGQYLVLGTTTSPYLITYKWSISNNKYEQKTIDAGLTSTGRGIALSPNGRYMAAASYGTPKLKTYDMGVGSITYEAYRYDILKPQYPSILKAVGRITENGNLNDIRSFNSIWSNSLVE